MVLLGSFFCGVWGLFSLFEITKKNMLLVNHRFVKKALILKTILMLINVQVRIFYHCICLQQFKFGLSTTGHTYWLTRQQWSRPLHPAVYERAGRRRRHTVLSFPDRGHRIRFPQFHGSYQGHLSFVISIQLRWLLKFMVCRKIKAFYDRPTFASYSHTTVILQRWD